MNRQEDPRVNVDGMVEALSGQTDVIVAYLFGSVARGQARPDSDIDIAVLLDADLDPRDLVLRQLDLMALLEPHSDHEVQVVLLNTASPQLAYEAIKNSIRLTQRSEKERVAFEVRAMKRYFDIKPMLAFQNQVLYKQIREVGLGGGRRRNRNAVEVAERLLARLTQPSRD